MRIFLTFYALILLSFQIGAAQAAQPSLVEQFQKVEDGWSVAVAHKDQYALDNLLAPSFIDIAADGEVSTRNLRIANTLAGLPNPVLSMEQRVVNVRVVSDVAVVEGTYRLKLKDGLEVRDERGIFTHLYQKLKDRWQCINAQRTATVNEVEGKKANQKAALDKGLAAPLSRAGDRGLATDRARLQR